MSWEIESHSTIDKSFGMGNDRIWMKVDFDDVYHREVDAAAAYLKNLIDLNWNNEEFIENYFIPQLKKEWSEDSDLQEEYPTIEDYINSRI